MTDEERLEGAKRAWLIFKIIGPLMLVTSAVLIVIAATQGEWLYAGLGFLGTWGIAALFAPWLAKLRRVALEIDPLPPESEKS